MTRLVGWLICYQILPTRRMLFSVVKIHVLEILILILFFCFSVFKADFYDWIFTGKIDWFEVGLIEIEDELVFFTGLTLVVTGWFNYYFSGCNRNPKNRCFYSLKNFLILILFFCFRRDPAGSHQFSYGA